MAENRFVITISHQLGCGGAALGQKLSERLGIPFFDREILKRVAEQFHLAEGALEGREDALEQFLAVTERIAV
jgi:cytidylate kinase